MRWVGRLGSREGGELDDLGQTVVCICVLKSIEDGTHLAISNVDLWVHRPFLDRLDRHAFIEHRTAKDILSNGDLQPIVTLRESFKRRCRCMHTIVANIWLRVKAELLPFGQNLSSE